MTDLFSRLGSGDVLPVIIIGIVFATIAFVAILITIGMVVYKVRREETLGRLKQDMLNRGMSAEEIKTVIESGGPKE